VYYSLDLEQFRALYRQAGEQLHPAIAGAEARPGDGKQQEMLPLAPLSVLFLCTGNSARSQMAEALLRQLSHGTVTAKSAGSHPAEHVHPLAVQVMEHTGINMSQAHPKHFEALRGQHFDKVVTVCDRVREICPTFPDDPERIHWSFPDPAEVEGSEDVQYQAFEQTSLQLATRIRLLITLLKREQQRQRKVG
jgi:protein-tyrosine-phosphatase